MPILWKALLKPYFRTFSLSVTLFLAVLFILRFREIARFSALSGAWTTTIAFTLYQFPLILPIAIPISAFLAAYLLMQRLSKTSELTAFRASTCSLLSLFSPLFFSSLIITLVTFVLCAEVAPFCRKESKSMLFRKTSENPLLFMQRQQLGKLKHSYLSTKIDATGERASNLFLVTYNGKNDRLSLLWTPNLTLDQNVLKGEQIALISHYPAPQEQFDYLLLETQKSLSTNAAVVSHFLKKRHERLETLTLSFKQLWLRYQEEKSRSALVELFRRASLSFSVCTLTLLGFSFGIETGRMLKKRLPLFAIILLISLLISYLAAKEFKKLPAFAFSLSLGVHSSIWISSTFRLRKINKGLL